MLAHPLRHTLRPRQNPSQMNSLNATDEEMADYRPSC